MTTVAVFLSGCSSDEAPTPVGPAVGPSYVYGDFKGALANALIQVFAPIEWSGQTDGPVLVSAGKLFTLTDDQKIALKMVLSSGHAILVSEVTGEHIERLHEVNNSAPAISLEPSSADSAALYVLARPQRLMRVFVVPSFPDDGSGSPALEAAKKQHAEEVAKWFLEQRTLHAAHSLVATRLTGMTHLEETGASISDTFPFSVTLANRIRVDFSNSCSTTTSCSNYDPITISAVAVHDPKPEPGQPGDWIIGRLDATFNSDGCKLSIGTQNGWQSNRWAGLWTRQANMTAAVKSPVVYGDGRSFDILKNTDGALLIETLNGKYLPEAAAATEDVTKSMEKSFGVTGTVSAGVASDDGASVKGSVGFTAGVSYSKTSSQKFEAAQVIPHIWEDETNPTKVGWTFDSWNFVKNNIKPPNHACGGPGLDIRMALPAEIYGSGLPPHAEWIWAMNPKVRTALEGLPTRKGATVYLPVQLTGSVLMGWSFFPAMIGQYCRMGDASLGQFRMVFNSNFIDVVRADRNHEAGLAFDSGCGTEVLFGTIPLGSWTSGVIDGSNVGNPFSLGSLVANIPLAPNPRLMSLTSICVNPTLEGVCQATADGPAGSSIVLKGKNLHMATHVTIGALPASTSMNWSGDPLDDAELTAIVPYRTAPGSSNLAEIQVQNPVTTTGGFTFTYK